MRALASITAFCLAGAACVTALADLPGSSTWLRPAETTSAPDPGPAPRAAPRLYAAHMAADEPPPPPASAAAPAALGAAAPPGGAIFVNTYYDFPEDDGAPQDTLLYSTKCEPIARVSRSFHDRVCVQGSGRLASGATVSFARRGCACAEICPRTGQRVCFEALDPARFPHGRGTTGRAITPLRTVAVDPAVIPLGTPIFIPEYVGLPRPDGTLHDGCFVAEDRGLRIVGRRVDVFAGSPATKLLLEAIVPSHRGVHVLPGGPRCTPPGRRASSTAGGPWALRRAR